MHRLGYPSPVDEYRRGGKFGKTFAELTVIGEFPAEVTIIYGRFSAAVTSHPSWDLAPQPKTARKCQGNMPTAEEEVVVRGLLWKI